MAQNSFWPVNFMGHVAKWLSYERKSSISESKSNSSNGRRRSRIATYWITVYGFLIFSTSTVSASWGQSDFYVQLVANKYVDYGSTIKLECNSNVKENILSKVSWLKNGNKIFEYIKGRNPPYRNFSIPGAEIDWKNSNENTAALRVRDFNASGEYSCEVSTDTPIFTKESNIQQIHIIQPQGHPPRITFSKERFFLGDNVVANCTTFRAFPQPHITWLINGKKVDEKHIRVLHPHSLGGKLTHRQKNQSHTGNNLQSVEDKMTSLEPDIVDGQLPSDTSGLQKATNSLQQRLNERMGKIEHYPYYPSMAFDDDEIGGSEIQSLYKPRQQPDYQRVIIDEHGIVHNKHLKFKRLRNAFGGSSGNSGMNRRHAIQAVRTLHGMMASSMLVVEVSELHADSNGRLEITCLATIPAHVGPGEQFADYKTFSVKIDVERNDVTTGVPQPAKLNNNVSSGSSSSTTTSVTSSSIRVLGRTNALGGGLKLLWRQHIVQLTLGILLIGTPLLH